MSTGSVTAKASGTAWSRGFGIVDVVALVDASAFAPLGLKAADLTGGLRVITPMESRDLGTAPISMAFDWGDPAGIDRVEVRSTVLRIDPPSASDPGISLGVLGSRIADGSLEVDVPGGRSIRRLHIASLETDEEEPVTLAGRADLDGIGRRLAVSALGRSGGFDPVATSVPAVWLGEQVGWILTGSSYEAGVLTLPDLSGRRLRISLVDGATPTEFSSVAITAGSVTGWAAPAPRDLSLKGPDGTVLWAFPEVFAGATPTASVDVALGVQNAVTDLLAGGEPLRGAVTLSAAAPSRADVGMASLHADLVRDLPGVTKVVLDGDPAAAPLGGAPLRTEVPSAAVADVVVTYDGIRLTDLSDPLPIGRSVDGVVVGGEPVRRALPPDSLVGEKVARVGIVGRATASSKLTIALVDAGSRAQQPVTVGDPSVVSVAPPPASAPGELAVVWAVFDPPIDVTGWVAVSVTATEGSFLWVSAPEPLVRIAVVDPDPGGRPILLDGQPLLTLAAPSLAAMRASLPTAPFGSGATELELASALFCSVELTDLELRYARRGD